MKLNFRKHKAQGQFHGGKNKKQNTQRLVSTMPDAVALIKKHPARCLQAVTLPAIIDNFHQRLISKANIKKVKKEYFDLIKLRY